MDDSDDYDSENGSDNSDNDNSDNDNDVRFFKNRMTRLLLNDEPLIEIALDEDDYSVLTRGQHYRDELLVSLRNNTTLQECYIFFPFNPLDFTNHPGGFEQFCREMGHALGGIPTLKILEFVVMDNIDYRAVGFILEETRQITSLKLNISSSRRPPDLVDRAMMYHPAIETIRLAYRVDDMDVDDDDDDNEAANGTVARNPLANSIGTMQKLKTLAIINGHELPPRLDEFRPTLNTLAVSELKLGRFHLLPADMRAIGNNIRLKKLTDLDLSYCALFGDKNSEDAKFLFQQLSETSTLDELALCPGNWHSELAAALGSNKEQELKVLRAISSGGDPTAGLCSLLWSLTINGCCLSILDLERYKWNRLLCTALNEYLECDLLCALFIDECCPEPSFTDELFKLIIPGVAKLDGLRIGGVFHELGTTLLQAENKLSLMDLTVSLPHSIVPETLVECAPLLRNTKIQEFAIQGHHHQYCGNETAKLSIKQGQSVLAALENNYNLTIFPFEIVPRDWDLGSTKAAKEATRIKDHIQMILRMNKVGRSCLKEGEPRDDAVELMVKLRDDLGCLHMILLEKPLLCRG